MPLFERRSSQEDAIYAEAQALIDDGLDPSFVLGLYPREQDWLAPLLETAAALNESYATAQPSFYFEGSLRAKFLAAGRERFERRRVPPMERARAAFAAGSVMLAAGAAGVVTLGFVTAPSAVPGDWNYSFKLASERAEMALARGDDRINVQISHTAARVQEIQRLSDRGDVSPSDLARVQHEVQSLRNHIERAGELDENQVARVGDIVDTTVAVLGDLQKQPALEPAVANVNKAIADTATAAGVGAVTSVTPVPEPSPTPTATSSPAATPTAPASPSATGTAATPAGTPAPPSPAPTEGLSAAPTEGTPTPAR